MKMSIDDIELYMKCPRAYRLHVLKEVLPQYKTLSLCKSITTKKVIFSLHKEKKILEEYSCEEIEKLCDTIWQSEISDPQINWEEMNTIVVQAKTDKKNKEVKKAVTKGDRALAEIKDWCVNYSKLEKRAKVLYSNLYFEDKIGDVIFCGHIDQIRENQEAGLDIIMFKTSSQVLPLSYLTREFSLSLAIHAVWQGTLYTETGEKFRLEKIPSAYCYYFPNLEMYKTNNKGKKGEIKGDPMIAVHRGQEVLFDFEYELLEVVAGIRMRYFPMRVVNPCGCSLCQFSHQCKSGVAQPVVNEYAEILE